VVAVADPLLPAAVELCVLVLPPHQLGLLQGAMIGSSCSQKDREGPNEALLVK
jgi:hypothetical protein